MREEKQLFLSLCHSSVILHSVHKYSVVTQFSWPTVLCHLKDINLFYTSNQPQHDLAFLSDSLVLVKEKHLVNFSETRKCLKIKGPRGSMLGNRPAVSEEPIESLCTAEVWHRII